MPERSTGNSMAGVPVCAPKRNENRKNLWKRENHHDGETNSIWCLDVKRVGRILV